MDAPADPWGLGSLLSDRRAGGQHRPHGESAGTAWSASPLAPISQGGQGSGQQGGQGSGQQGGQDPPPPPPSRVGVGSLGASLGSGCDASQLGVGMGGLSVAGGAAVGKAGGTAGGRRRMQRIATTGGQGQQ
jgi:hypothetical protein